MSDRSALVAYGSETGNACEYAQELGQLVQRLRFSADIVPLDSVVDAVCVQSFKDECRTDVYTIERAFQIYTVPCRDLDNRSRRCSSECQTILEEFTT